MTKRKTAGLSKPSSKDQIMAYAEESTESTDPIFSGAFFRAMSSLLKTRDKATKNELVKEVKKVLDEKFESHLSTVETKVNELNNAFHAKMIEDVSEVIKKQWPNAMAESMKDYTKARDRKLLKYIVISGILVIIISVATGLAIFIWWHNKYYPNPIPAKLILPAILSFFGLT